jgi:hypothetical protein
MAKTVQLKAATGKKDTPDYKEKTYDYTDPEDLQEAISMWGEKKVFELAVAQAHTDSINAARLELKGKEPGVVSIGKALLEKAKEAKAAGDTATLKALEAILGMPL